MINRQYHQNPEVYSKKIGQKYHLLNPKSDQVLQLNQTGGFIWKLLKTKHTLLEIVEKQHLRYKVSKKTGAKDTKALLRQFLKFKLIKVN